MRSGDLAPTLQTRATVVEVRTHAEGATCGYAFTADREELIYAWLDDDGRWTTDLCSRTTPLDDADDDLAVLGGADDPQPGDATGPLGSPGEVTGTWLLVAGGLILVLVVLLIWPRRRGPPWAARNR